MYWINQNQHIEPLVTICTDSLRTSGQSNEPSVQLSFANGELKRADIQGRAGQPSQGNGQLHFDTASGHLHLIVELVALSRGSYHFNWTVTPLNTSTFSLVNRSAATGSSPQFVSTGTSTAFASVNSTSLARPVIGSQISTSATGPTMHFNLFPTSNCSLQCPEQRVCLSLEQLCDEIANCPVTAWDESPQVCEARARNELGALILSQPIHSPTSNDQEQHVHTLPVVITQHWLSFILPVFIISLICISAIVFYFRSTLTHKWLSRPGNRLQAPLHPLSTVASSSSSSSGSSCCGMGSGGGPCNCLRPLPFTTKKSKHLKAHQTTGPLLLPSSGQPLFSTNGLHPMQSSQLTGLSGKGFSALADYVSTQEFQFELNQDRLSGYDQNQSSQQTLPHAHHLQQHHQQPSMAYQHTLQPQSHLFTGHHPSMYNAQSGGGANTTVRPPPAYRSSLEYNETTSAALSNDLHDVRHEFNEFGYPPGFGAPNMNRDLSYPTDHQMMADPDDDGSEYGGANHIYQQPSYLSLQRHSRSNRPDLLHDSQLGHYAMISTPPPLPTKSPPPIPPPPISLAMHHGSSASSSVSSSTTSGFTRSGTLALHSRSGTSGHHQSIAAPFRTMRKPL